MSETKLANKGNCVQHNNEEPATNLEMYRDILSDLFDILNVADKATVPVIAAHAVLKDVIAMMDDELGMAKQVS